MKRTELRFPVLGSVLSTACDRKAEHHKTRLAYWIGEEASVLEEVKGSSITVREYTVTGGTRVEASVDPTFTNRLSEAKGKIEKHKKLIAEYGRYGQGFSFSASVTFELDIDDMEFFDP